MAITKKRKDELVAQYKELVEKSQAIILAEYGGMSVKSMENFRAEVLKNQGAFHVTKNTLLSIALEETDWSVPEELLAGQIAASFATTDIAGVVKTLMDLAKKEEKFKLKGGILGKQVLGPKEVESLSTLPTLDQLRAQLIGLINAPAQNLVSVVTGGVRQVVNVLDAYAKKDDSGGETAESAPEPAAA